MDIARLGLAVDSSQVEKGTVSLKQLTGAAGQASAAARNLAGASNTEAAAQRTATAATAAHTAALKAQGAIMRSTAQQRTMMVYQLNDVAVSLASGMNPAMVAMQQGSQILQGGLMPAIRTLVDLGKSLVVTFWPVAAVIGAVSVALAGMTHEINETSAVTVGFGDVALATWQVIAGGIYEIIRPAVEMMGGWFGTAWDWVVQATKDAGNWIIRSIVGSIEYVKTAVGTLPAAFIVAGEAAAQGLADAVASGINMIIGNINSLSAGINQLAGSQILGQIGGVDFGKIDIGGSAAQQSWDESWGKFNNTAAALGERDFMGQFFGAISGRAQELALARQEMDALGGSAKAANDNVKLLDQGLGELTHWTDSFGKAAQSAFSNLGTGIVEAFRKGGDVASNVLNMLMDKVGQFGETLLNNGLNGLLNMGLNALGGMLGGGTWGVAGGFSGFPGIFGIPGMATGGTVARSGLSWVGEQGPELLRLPAGAEVIPNAPSMAMAANQNGSGLTININGSGLSEEQLGRAIASGIRDYDAGLAPKVENKMRQMMNDPRAADGGW